MKLARLIGPLVWRRGIEHSRSRRKGERTLIVSTRCFVRGVGGFFLVGSMGAAEWPMIINSLTH